MLEEQGEFIFSMREAAGLTRAELAERLNISVATLEAFERGQTKMAEIKKFERYLREIVKEEIRKKRRHAVYLVR